jgi:FkbM family methyltransferase
MDNEQIHNFERWVRKFNVPRSGIVHVGAHFAEERDLYHDLGYEPVLWVEAIPSVATEAERLLQDFPLQEVVSETLWRVPGEKKEFFVSSNEGSSSSILPLHLHKSSHPEVVTSEKFEVVTSTLDNLYQSRSVMATQCRILILDTQGSELDVLRGGVGCLDKFDYILSEVSIRQLYKGGALHKELKKYLKKKNFIEVAHNISRESGWGDAFYVSKKVIEAESLKLNSADFVTRGRRFAFGIHLRNLLVRLGISPENFTRENFLKNLRRG